LIAKPVGTVKKNLKKGRKKALKKATQLIENGSVTKKQKQDV